MIPKNNECLVPGNYLVEEFVLKEIVTSCLELQTFVNDTYSYYYCLQYVTPTEC